MDTVRNSALSALRVCVILLVLVHHSVLGYCRLGQFDRQHYLWSSAPIVDPKRWIGFDVIVDFNDAYFMSLMFLISGLFVLPSLRRKGMLRYASGRILRLGVPFVVCITIIMPIAYYPSYRQTGHAISFGTFWLGIFQRYGWPGGPAWFIWFLLTLDLLFIALTRIWPTLQIRLAALPNQIVSRPGRSLALIFGLAMAATLPADWLFGPSSWFSWGPFAVQKSRVLLYALFFAVGVAAGSSGSHHLLLAPDGPIGRHWRLCSVCALSAFAVYLACQLHALHRHKPDSYLNLVIATTFVPTCVFCSLALTAVFIRHVHGRVPLVDWLAANAYGIYLVHYVVVTWTQTQLLQVGWSAIVKATLVLAIVIASSLAAAVLARQNRVVNALIS